MKKWNEKGALAFATWVKPGLVRLSAMKMTQGLPFPRVFYALQPILCNHLCPSENQAWNDGHQKVHVWSVVAALNWGYLLLSIL